MKKLTFKLAWAIWRGKTKSIVEHHVTIWTLVVLALSSIPSFCMETFAHFIFHKTLKKKED